MKQGDVLNGYTVVSKPTNAGGGKCMWAFASKDGEEFFIKKFLEPKWPLESAPGDADSKRRRRSDCTVFEERHKYVMDRLKSDSVGSGNIVIAEAFFRDGATYYKVTKRIDASNLESLVDLTARQKAVVLRTLALSLQQLHKISIVHGDLKPDNVLVQKRPGNDLYTAKLIDFDDSYPVGKPPAPGAVGGDSAYGAPEWLRYVQDEGGGDGAALTTAADMFSLGLMLHEYLTGELPGFPGAFGSPGYAVKAGQRLTPSTQLHPKTSYLVLSLTHSEPGRRPGIEAFLKAVDDESKLEFPYDVRELPSGTRGAPGDPRPSRIKTDMRPGGNGSARGSEHRPATGAPSPPTAPVKKEPERAARPSRLRINLGDAKSADRRDSRPASG
jgi:eukaryotic-like serine/threonine-protein kinase